ncbi:ty1-copia retrotransposon protein [Cucumis melo var. makuwa]|uniref:Ty1-copia retrotransposon protein n=1 Tax=Cucumis melo var. makuwa TaxID=1194695 RepID=A0A5A7SN16_CUCMM|nr:ty1-copia retrotransposon protein [Cucumis melo var. makuwa]
MGKYKLLPLKGTTNQVSGDSIMLSHMHAAAAVCSVGLGQPHLHLPSSDPPTTTSTSSDPESSTGPPTTVAVTDQVKKDQVIDPEKYAKDNKTVRGHLLNHMSDPMFDLFVVQKSAKDIWSTLESRYEGDDAGRKKYVVGKWLQFQMTDDKPVVEQIHEYENLVANVLSEGVKMCEILQANVLLEKFPPSWNDYQQDSEIIAAIVEANLIENKTDWILDTGASRHFCTNRELLYDYEDTADGECVFMGNSATAGVIGKGKVILKLTSGKTLSLSNVLYVPSLRRNLVFGSLLNRARLKIVLEGDKVVLTKNGDFVGKGYLSNGLFVLNTISMNANASSSAYLIESADLWHGRLGHVNFASIRKLKDLRLINTSQSHKTGKCPICVESKFHKKPFKPVEYRTTELIPHKRLDKTPYELWKGHAPNLSYLKVWGCLAKVPFLALKKTTVRSKTFDCIFIGYAQNSAAYRMHDPEIVSETPGSETVDTLNLCCELELRRSKRQRTEKSFGPDFLSTFIVERRDEIDCNFTNLYLIDEDPKTYQEALNSVDSSMWKEAIKSELDSLVMNHTWELVDLPMGNKPIRYLGEADVILGVKIRKNKTSLSLCQSHYVEKILKKFDSFDVSPVRTPFDASKHLKKNKGDSVSQPEYAKIIGSVMYLMNYTRPDIAYAVSRLSRYTHNPNRYHWDALRRLLRYLKGTIDYCLHFNKFPTILEGYCDANWVIDNDEVNSTCGYVFLLGGGAISWKSTKQTCIARSTMESEFIALELAGQEVVWIKNLLGDVPLWGTSVPESIQCDSHAVVKQLLKEGTIFLDFVRSEKNLANPLTKGLTRKMALDSSMNMGLKPFRDS